MHVCGSLDIAPRLLSLHSSTPRKKNRVTKSITVTSQEASLSCYKWLPQLSACQGWAISHSIACRRLSVNCQGGLCCIFILLSGIGDATKRGKSTREQKPAGGGVNYPQQDSWTVTPASEKKLRRIRKLWLYSDYRDHRESKNLGGERCYWSTPKQLSWAQTTGGLKQGCITRIRRNFTDNLLFNLQRAHTTRFGNNGASAESRFQQNGDRCILTFFKRKNV